MLCEGVELCEPCASIQRRTGKPVLKPLVRRGGLYARILESGTVRTGDVVAAVETPARA
jgi:MOSC domain-containing protein YiiM